MTHFILTGCAGFIGSHFVDRLLSLGHIVTGIDNFSTGHRKFLNNALNHSHFQLIELDLLDVASLTQACKKGEFVIHLAANADVRMGTQHPRKDLEQNTLGTHNILEAMRVNKIQKIAFASTGSVYGEASLIPTPEDAPFPIQTSFYAASKLAAEALICAYCEGFGIQSWIFRFVSVLGERYTHGHVFDFYKQLQNDPSRLSVLGNGKQRKSYIYVHDCIDAMLLAMNKANEKINLFNLGVDAYCEVNQSIDWICKALDVKPELSYSGGDRGWVGDNPFIYLDTTKIKALSWKPNLSIQQSILKTVDFLRANEWVFKRND